MSSNLSLAHNEIDLVNRTRDLKHSLDALDALQRRIASPKPGTARRSVQAYDVLVMTQEYQQSVLESKRLRESRVPLKQQIGEMEQSLTEYNRLLASIEQSPYLRAMNQRVTIAFVPYENMASLANGMPVYGCDLGIVWCHRVGEVVRALDGEVAAKHPLHSREVRGAMIEVKLSDARWAEGKTLHLGRAPFIL